MCTPVTGLREQLSFQCQLEWQLSVECVEGRVRQNDRNLWENPINSWNGEIKVLKICILTTGCSHRSRLTFLSEFYKTLLYMILFSKREHYCCNFPVTHSIVLKVWDVAYGVKSGNDSQGLQVDFSRIEVWSIRINSM